MVLRPGGGGGGDGDDDGCRLFALWKVPSWILSVYSTSFVLAAHVEASLLNFIRSTYSQISRLRWRPRIILVTKYGKSPHVGWSVGKKVSSRVFCLGCPVACRHHDIVVVVGGRN
eukprot:scaffold49170_cov32-Attheya_sp.AAC.1